MISLKAALLVATLAGGLGFSLGYIIRILIALGKKGSLEIDIRKMMVSAKEEANHAILKAEEQAADTLKNAREEVKEREENIKKTEERLVKKEEFLDNRQAETDKQIEDVNKAKIEIEGNKEGAEKALEKAEKELKRIAKLDKKEAQFELFKKIEEEEEEAINSRLRKLEINGEDTIKKAAQDILAISIQRLATSVSSDLFTSSVHIESEDVKGKIIGKEGRNIKTFEKETGVEVIIDDSPNTITLSSFDPVRRAIAKIALDALIKDGRIQPARIEKEVENAKKEIGKIVKEKGEEATYECGILNLDPRLVSILGRLHFRTSYGHNVLQHSIECSHIAGIIAEEISANVRVAKTAALLHDIGKALDHEVSGTHVEIGIQLLEKFGVHDDIIRAMRAHHEEYPYDTVESRIVQTADAISGGRPGARKDNIESYVKRLAELEQIATSFVGVEKAYALQAGREIRVFINPADLGDVESRNLAREIALKIESELRYPGEIKVTVIRETRVIEVAR